MNTKEQFKGVHDVQAQDTIFVLGLFGMKIPKGYSYSMDQNILGEKYALRIQRSDDIAMEAPYGVASFTFNLLTSSGPFEIVEPTGTGTYVSDVLNMDEVAYQTENIKVGIVKENELGEWKSYSFSIRIHDLNTQIGGVIQLNDEYDNRDAFALEVLKWIFDLSEIAGNYDDYPSFYDYTRLSFTSGKCFNIDDISIPIPDGFKLVNSKYILPDKDNVISSFVENNILPGTCVCLSVPTSGSDLKIDTFDIPTLCKVATILRNNVPTFNGAFIYPLVVNNHYACLCANSLSRYGNNMISSQTKLAVLNKKKLYFFILTTTFEMSEAEYISAIMADGYRLEHNIFSKEGNSEDVLIPGANAGESPSFDKDLFVIDDTGRLIEYKGNDIEDLVLPEGITIIEDELYNGVFFNHKELQSIVIPEGVTAIGGFTFNECKKLSKVILPSTIKTLGEFAFCGSALTSIEIPDGCESIGEACFYANNNMKDIFVPESVTTFGEDAFDTFTDKTIIHTVRGSKADEYAQSVGKRVEYL